MGWHFDPFQHRGPDGKWSSAGGEAGKAVLKLGSQARTDYNLHTHRDEIGAHLQAAQQAVKAGYKVEAHHHLTNALKAASKDTGMMGADALKATISSRRSKLGVTKQELATHALNEKAAAEVEASKQDWVSQLDGGLPETPAELTDKANQLTVKSYILYAANFEAAAAHKAAAAAYPSGSPQQVYHAATAAAHIAKTTPAADEDLALEDELAGIAQTDGPLPAYPAAVGDSTLKHGSAAYQAFVNHKEKQKIGAHLYEAQKAIKAGDLATAHAHLTAAGNVISSSGTSISASALKATISSKKSKLGVKSTPQQVSKAIAKVNGGGSTNSASDNAAAHSMTVKADAAKLDELAAAYDAAKTASASKSYTDWKPQSVAIKKFLADKNAVQLAAMKEHVSGKTSKVALGKAIDAKPVNLSGVKLTGDPYANAVAEAAASAQGSLAGKLTPAQKSAISSWKSSSAAISKSITGIINGKKSESTHANAIWKALQEHSEPAPKGVLHRGMKWVSASQLEEPGSKALFDAFKKGPGAEFDAGAASWSKRKSVAENFSGSGSGYAARLILTANNARGLDIHHIGSHVVEQEMISGGRYKVVEVKQEPGNVWRVQVEQVGAFG